MSNTLGINMLLGAEGGTRTHTESPPLDFESSASANSTTSAYIFLTISNKYHNSFINSCQALCCMNFALCCMNFAKIIFIFCRFFFICREITNILK